MKQPNMKKVLDRYQPPNISDDHLEKTVRLAKKEFARKKIRYRISLRELVVGQVKYISLSVWIAQTALLTLVFGLLLNARGSADVFESVVTTLSAFAPVIALVAIPELNKSFHHHMWEMEMTCKYTLQKLMAIRLLVISAIDVLFITGLVIFAGTFYDLSLISLMIYVLVPFNVASSIYLSIVSKIRGQKANWGCLGAGMLMALGMGMLSRSSDVYEWTSMFVWAVLLIVSTGIWIYEIAQLLKSMQTKGETLRWNSP